MSVGRRGSWSSSGLTESGGGQVLDAGHRRLLELFATWHVQRRLNSLADRGPLTSKQVQQARNEIRLAIAFLDHLAERGRTLAECTQADVDTWYAGGYTARRLTHAFLRWAMRSKHMRKVAVPHRSTSNPPLARHQRLTLLRQAVDQGDIPLQDRVVAALVLLYAQPLTRIARLTTDDVLHVDGEVLVRLVLGYHDDTTAKLAAEAGGTWRHYAPGDHSR